MDYRLKSRTQVNIRIHPFLALVLLLFLAGLFWLSFPKALADQEIVEIYSNEGVSKDTQALRMAEYSEQTQAARDEIRISRPDEAASRVAFEQADNLVAGVERLRIPLKQEALLANDAQEKLPEEIAYQKMKTGRGLASQKPEHQNANVRIAPVISSHPKKGVPVQEVSLITNQDGFYPKEIIVTKGRPVKLYLATSSKATSCFMLDRFAIKKGIEPQKVEEVSFVPHHPGKFRVHCPIGNLEGTLIVKEPAPMVSRALSSIEVSPLEPITVADEHLRKKNDETSGPSRSIPKQLNAIIEE